MNMNLPNIITTFRIVFSPVFLLLFIIGEEEWGLVVFVFVALSDLVDGWVARREGMSTLFGGNLDAFADKFMLSLALVVLILYYDFPLFSLPFLLFRDFFSVIGIIVIKKAHLRFKFSKRTYFGKLATLFQVVTALAYMADFRFKVAVLVAACLFILVSGTKRALKVYSLCKNS